MKKIIAFNWFGGKYMHAEFVLKHLPKSRTYVEVFGGSAVILLNRAPSKIEVYNDIYSEIVNFFKVLREQPQELINSIYLTPYSIEEYKKSYRTLQDGTDLERARKFFCVVNQSFNASTSRQTGWKISTEVSRARISEAVNRWLTKIPNLYRAVERLRTVQICNHDFRVIFEKFDSPNTLFYCDPPYMHHTRCNNDEYENELSPTDHQDLLHLCLHAKGKVAISGYSNEIYSDALKDFEMHLAPEKRTGLFHSSNREVLWTNYKISNHTLFTQEHDYES